MRATSGEDSGRGPVGRGPVYDNALRQLAGSDLVAVCHWLGIEAEASSLRLSEALPATTQYADLVASVGPGRRAHVEFTRVTNSDLPLRMLEYRARIMRMEPDVVLTQHVVVLAGGTVPEQLTNGADFAMRIHITYLRAHDPAELLTSASLAPLAVLARADSNDARAGTLRDALTLIKEMAPPERRHELASIAVVLAAIHLDSLTIDAIGKETSMPISLEGTIGGKSLEARGEARGVARGQAIAATGHFAAMLRRRFGDDPRIPDLAAALATRPTDEAMDAALGARSLDDLSL